MEKSSGHKNSKTQNENITGWNCESDVHVNSQPIFTCSKSTMKTREQFVKSVQC